MQSYFYNLADRLAGELRGAEIYLCRFSAEVSDFVRFNRGRIRQAGTVAQRYLKLQLIDGRRHATGELSLSGEPDSDWRQITALLRLLRERLPQLSEDPYLLYAREVHSGEQVGGNRLPEADEVVAEILGGVQDLDFVGLYAGGAIYKGFANSFGQRNWHASHSFNLDWSLYHLRDKAVKNTYAGFVWDSRVFGDKLARAKAQLEILKQPARTLGPGLYRAYLAPAALYELLGLLGLSGFSLKAQRTKYSSLLRMLENVVCLHPSVTLKENTAGGVGPDFEAHGFRKPPQVTLIEYGIYRNALVSPRSAQEYGVPGNAANDMESPEALDMAPGNLPLAEVLRELDTGIYLNNLWYLNYSDRPACRITGMTRFASFWVENGRIAAPLNVMRFDETIYRLLGENLLELTRERELIFDPGTYEERSTASMCLPGALVKDFTLTL